MKKVKAIFELNAPEIWELFYLNNKLVETFTEYEELCNYCTDNNLDLVQSKGL